MSSAKKKLAVVESKKLLKLDFGCGPNPREGFDGCDQYSFKGKAKHVFNIGKASWPFRDETVEEAHASHFIEHLTSVERVHFFNELYRVLVPGGKCLIITPHWASNRAYGDPTHKWPPVAEFGFYYIRKEWRMANAPHTDAEHWNDGYKCDFEATWGYQVHPQLSVRNQEFQRFAIEFYKEAAMDLHCTVTKPLPKPKEA